MKYDEAGMKKILTNPVWSLIGNLPSNFFPYEYKELYVRPLTVHELRLISKAAVLGEIQHVIRAVDLCISQDANELAIGDFYYVLMWLKIHSTPKTPYVVDWHCTDQVWRKLSDNQILPMNDTPGDPKDYVRESCGCHNSEVIHITDVEIIQLPEEGWEDLPPDFDFPRTKILGEVRAASTDPELRFVAGPAQWISHGNTLEEKIKFLESQPDLDMFETAAGLNDLLVLGVKETTTLNCRNCRAQHPFQIQLEPYNFFR